MNQQITMPHWTPQSVAEFVWKLQDKPMSDEHRAILRRLSTDVRMKNVWTALASRRRPSGKLVNPVLRERYGDEYSDEDAQAKIMTEVFHFAFHVGCNPPHVSKADEVELVRRAFVERAKVLRGAADELVATVRALPGVHPNVLQKATDDAEAVRRVAVWLETNVKNHIRQQDDPMTITKDRGARDTRGAQIVFGAFFLRAFGSRHDRISTTLTEVALGISRLTSRPTRSALSRQKGI